jgi:hypothetical protein
MRSIITFDFRATGASASAAGLLAGPSARATQGNPIAIKAIAIATSFLIIETPAVGPKKSAKPGALQKSLGIVTEKFPLTRSNIDRGVICLTNS